MSSSRETFHLLDYLIFSLMLLVSCAIGVYQACRAKKRDQVEYLMGNRQMKWLPVALSLMVSFYSGVSQLGKPAELYMYGIQFSVGVIGLTLGQIIALFTFLPLLYNLKLTSSYEYLELRFHSKAVRCLGSFIVILSQILYCGIATYSPAVALQAVTGFPIWASIICVGTVATFYTLLGGMKAVVWADAFQSVIMLCGLLFIIVLGVKEVGGLKAMWSINKSNGRINFFNFDPDPVMRLSFWSLTIGTMFSFLPFYAVNQTSVQRYCSVPTLRKAKLIVLMNIVLLIAMETLIYIIGLVIYSYFSECDPLEHPDPGQRLSSPNQLLPLFVMKVINWPGIPGVFLASLFSGSFSTVSSCLNAMAAVTWEDFFKWKFDYLSERTKANVLKIMVLLYGVIGIVFAFLASFLQGSVLQAAASFMDTSLSPLMGIFILGAFFTKTNWLGAIVGGCLGLALPMWMSLGSYLVVPVTPPLPTSIAGCFWNGTSTLNSTVTPLLQHPVQGIKKLYTVSFMWFPMIGTLTTVIVGLIASATTAPFIKPGSPNIVKDAHIIYPLDRWSYNSKRRLKKDDALENAELKEFST